MRDAFYCGGVIFLQCTQCLQWKPRDDFYDVPAGLKHSKSGKRGECKNCDNAQRKQRKRRCLEAISLAGGK